MGRENEERKEQKQQQKICDYLQKFSKQQEVQVQEEEEEEGTSLHLEETVLNS